MKQKFRTAFSSDLRVKPKVKFTGPSRTHQSFKDECDINNILQKYNKGMAVTHLNKAIPQYGDVSQFTDYQDSVHQVMFAHELFETLPARAREKFDNDPQKMMLFLANPQNHKEAVSLGLMEKRPEAAPPVQPEPKSPVPTPNPKNAKNDE